MTVENDSNGSSLSPHAGYTIKPNVFQSNINGSLAKGRIHTVFGGLLRLMMGRQGLPSR